MRLLSGSEGRSPSTAPSPGGRDRWLDSVYRVAVLSLLLASCAPDGPFANLPTVATKPTPHLVASPEEAARLVRANVTAVAPVLLPTSFPAPMTALVTLGQDSFSVMYMDESTDLRVHIGIVAANPSAPQGREGLAPALELEACVPPPPSAEVVPCAAGAGEQAERGDREDEQDQPDKVHGRSDEINQRSPPVARSARATAWISSTSPRAASASEAYGRSRAAIAAATRARSREARPDSRATNSRTRRCASPGKRRTSAVFPAPSGVTVRSENQSMRGFGARTTYVPAAMSPRR